jgi:hypothetical protein
MQTPFSDFDVTLLKWQFPDDNTLEPGVHRIQEKQYPVSKA